MSGPGPRSRELSDLLRRFEAPGVNTLGGKDGSEPSVVWAEAEGATVVDVDGRRYLDLTSGFGVAAVGHRHPRVVAAVREQAGKLLHGLGDVAAHPTRIELAGRLAEIAPVGDPSEERRVHFAISGADAIEVAAKTAILATGKPGLVAFEPSYHGLTLGALALTARDHFREPFRHLLHPHVHRLPFGCAPERLRDLLASAQVAGVVVEPVVGREGVLFPPPGWLAALAAACRDHGALLIADEIFTGFGRTGGRTGSSFAVEHESVRPDLVCCGKALGGGLPIGAVVGRAEVMDAWRAEGEARHTGTFLANPLACAASLAVLDVLRTHRLAERAARLGERLWHRLSAWPDRFEAVAETRGRGLLWGVETHTAEQAKRATARLLDDGVLALAGGPAGDVVQIVPPLTIAEDELDRALDLFESALT